MRCVLDFMEWKHKAVSSTRPLDRSLQYFFFLNETWFGRFALKCEMGILLGLVLDWYRLCAISDFWRSVNEIFTLLGCYAARQVISYRRYGPIFNGQAWPLKMRPTGCPETSVTKYPSTLRNNSEQRLSKLGLFLQFRKMTPRCADFFTIGLPCNNHQELYITLNTILWVAVMHTSSPPPHTHPHTFSLKHFRFGEHLTRYTEK